MSESELVSDKVNEDVEAKELDTQESEESKELASIEGVLERVTEKDPEAGKIISQYIEHRSHRGPMPSPDDLQKYSETLDNLPDRMMKMAEKSQEEKTKQNGKILELKEQEIHVQKLEVEQASVAHEREISVQKLSLIFAFMIVLVCIVGSFVMAVLGHETLAAIVGGTTVVGVAASFLKGKSKPS